MLIKKKKTEKSLKKIFKKKIYFILLYLSIYTFSLVFVLENKRFFIPYLKKIIPVATKQMIKDSVPYQFYKSNFKVNVPLNFIKGLLEESEPIYLNIKQKEMEKLYIKRKEALEKGVLLTNENDFVNAIISEKNLTLKSKIRLKGDFPDHLQGDKWSFRVKTKGDQTFAGMQKFSLHAPVTRNYIWEWVYHNLLKEEGLPSLRYTFRPLVLNGKNLGIYALEEHFDKILLESNLFKEGPIIKISEDNYWLKRYQNVFSDVSEEYYKTFSAPFKLKKINRNKVLKDNLVIANKLLNGFREGKLLTSNVFDIKLLANYLAINDLTNAHHGSEWINERFYYDPVQAKLIPIGFDGDGVNEFILEELSVQKSDPWRKEYFKDIEFVKLYINALERISQKSYLDSFFEKYKKLFDKNASILYKSYPALEMKPNNLYKNQQIISKKLNPLEPLNIFLQEINEKKVTLQIGNKEKLPIEIISLNLGEKRKIINSRRTILKGKIDNEFVGYEEISFLLSPQDLKEYQNNGLLNISYKVYGTKQLKKAKINLFPRYETTNLNDFVLNNPSDLSKFKFIKVDLENKLIIIKPGIFNIHEPIIIPPNFILQAKEGTKLIFEKDGMLISFSAIDFKGNSLNPIIIQSNQTNNPQGITILNARNKSNLNNVIFKSLGNNDYRNWSVPGAITFYQSPVEIYKCSFENSRSEDSLNIIRSNFKISNSNFLSSNSDAIDIDFSKGEIKNLFIKNSKNDGLDLSGSNVIGENIKVENSGDKAFSIGEASYFRAENIYIQNASVGFAGKDGSFSEIDKLNLIQAKVDLVVFQKKPEYSPSNTVINNFSGDPNSLIYLIGRGSKLIIDDKNFETNSEDSIIFDSLY